MKYLILFTVALFTNLGFSQGTGMIIGKVLDKELKNEPLVFANISLKDSDLTSTSDVTGLFLLENLSDGKHTVICSYPGYKNKEIEVMIVSGQPTEVQVSLSARTLSLNTASISREEEVKLKKDAKVFLQQG